jgi:hypothetical protein
VGNDTSLSSVCDVSESKDHNYDCSDTMLPTHSEDAGGKIEGARIGEVVLKGMLEDKDGDSGDPMDNAEPALKDQEEGNGCHDFFHIQHITHTPSLFPSSTSNTHTLIHKSSVTVTCVTSCITLTHITAYIIMISCMTHTPYL